MTEMGNAQDQFPTARSKHQIMADYREEEKQKITIGASDQGQSSCEPDLRVWDRENEEMISVLVLITE
jgi:hypothetical protein